MVGVIFVGEMWVVFNAVFLLKALNKVEERGAHHDVDVHVVDELYVVEFWESLTVWGKKNLDCKGVFMPRNVTMNQVLF